MEFDKQPTLTGDLVLIRPLREDDFAELYAVASDPLIWEQHPAKDRWQESVYRKLFDESLASGGAIVILEAEIGKIIGSSRYHGFDPEKSEVEIGWTFLGRNYWGGVYNREVKKLMIEHAFKFVDSVVFMVGPDNTRSCRAMEKIGGIPEGNHTNAYGLKSRVYRITSDSWL